MKEATTKKRPLKAKKLTEKQNRFIDRFIETGNASEAADGIYGSNRMVARNIASETLAKPYIRLEVDRRYEEVQEFYKQKARRAAEVTAELMESAEDDRTKLLAAKDLQDRAGHKPIEKSQSVSVKKIMIDL